MHDHFSDDLRASIPEPPTTDGWVPAIRAKRRKRRLAAAGGVAVLAVALAVPLGLTLIDRGATTVPAGPSPSPSASPTVESSPSAAATEPPFGDVPPPCADGDGQPVLAAPLHDGEVTRAWLCGDETGYAQAGPQEPLVTDLSRIVEAFHALPAMSAEHCAIGEPGAIQRVVLEYADGTTGVIEVPDATCGFPVTDGDEEHLGEGFLDAIVALWQEQRANTPAPPVAEVASSLDCRAVQPTLLDPGLAHVVTGAACERLDDVDTPAPTPLPDGLATRLAAAMEAEATPRPDDFSPGASRGTLLLAGRWGDVVPVECWDEGCTFRGDAEMMLWQPTGELAAELDALLP